MPRLPPIPSHHSHLLTFYPSTTPSPAPRSLLILLHGLGDTAAGFISLAQKLNLPSTAYLIIRAPAPLPFDLEGFHWGDDITFSPAGVVDPDSGFTKSVRLLLEIVELVKDHGFAPRDVHFFGLGQGAMTALATCLDEAVCGSEFGGLVSLGGWLPEGVRGSGKSRTPVLLCHGSMRTAISSSRMQAVKARFETVQVVEWRGKMGDGMPSNADEMRSIMAFWGQRLRMPAPGGSVELSG